MTKMFWKIVTRFAILLSSAVLVVACGGGGISGSGNGGGMPGPEELVLGYSIEYLPESITLELPDSLVNSVDDNGDSQGPAVEISKSLIGVNELLLKFGLVQLYVDRAWKDIEGFCAGTPVGKSCEMQDSQISFVYTRGMAIWETNFRRELNGEPRQVAVEEDDVELHSDAQVKVGTTITIEYGRFTVLDDEHYDYEVVIKLSEFSTDHLLYQMRWNKVTKVVEAAVSDDDATHQFFFRSIYRSPWASSNESQQFVLVEHAGGIQQDLHTSQYRVPDSDSVFLESQLRVFDEAGVTEIFSQGNADNEGAYLLSETTSRDVNFVESTSRQQELISADSYSLSQCELSQSADNCESQNDWSLLVGANPFDSTYFLAENSLNNLSENGKLYDLQLKGVAGSADSYFVIKRENLTIGVGNNGLQVTIPGIGTLSWPVEESELATLQQNANGDYTRINDSLLCRIIPLTDETDIADQTYRSFCIGHESDIEDALVVAEYYEEGSYRIEWEAGGKVIVNPVE